MELLNIDKNAKTVKGQKYGFKTAILYLSPYTNNSKGINLCPHATKGCAEACLFNSGNGGMIPSVKNSRINKTELFLSDRNLFMNLLHLEISKLEITEKKYKLVVRLNGTSDIPFEKFKIKDNKNIFELHPNIQFYDYTKNFLRMFKDMPKNYHLTFSMSETNQKECFELLKIGKNVAVVFEKYIPETFNGFKVIQGDNSDLTFTYESGVIVGLKYKKLTFKGAREYNLKALESGFVIRDNSSII